jgi:hypothetical protein
VLNHTPSVLAALARYLGDGDREPHITASIRADLARFADLRRRQGVPLRGCLDEFAILSALVEDVITDGG